MTNSINGFRAPNLGATNRAAAPAAAPAAPAAASTGKLSGDTRVAATGAVNAVSGNASAAVQQAEIRLAAAWLSASN